MSYVQQTNMNPLQATQIWVPRTKFFLSLKAKQRWIAKTYLPLTSLTMSHQESHIVRPPLHDIARQHNTQQMKGGPTYATSEDNSVDINQKVVQKPHQVKRHTCPPSRACIKSTSEERMLEIEQIISLNFQSTSRNS